MPTNTSTSRRHRPPRVHVEVCFDPDDDLELTRGVHARCRPGSGRIALAPGPDTGTGTEVQLMLHLLCALSVLWRIPRRLHSGRAVIAGDDLAAVRWEISWGLHRAGVAELWVLRAEHVGYLGWMWLRELAEDEQLRLVLLTRGRPPNARQVAALRDCCWHHLNPGRLRLGGHADPPRPWWQHK